MTAQVLSGSGEASTSPRPRLETVEQVAELGDFAWNSASGQDSGWILARCGLEGCANVDFDALSALPEDERQRITAFSIQGASITHSMPIDFSVFPNLRGISLSDVNINELGDVDKLELRSLSLINVPITDVSFIEDLDLESLSLFEIPISDLSFMAGLDRASSIAVRSTVPLRLPTDLSRLASVEELQIQATPLESLDGIETIPSEFHLIVGDTNDISAIARSNATWVTMQPEMQTRFADEVALIEANGIPVSTQFE